MLRNWIKRKIEKKAGELKEKYREHTLSQFPRIEEDNEAISYWDSPKHVELFFKGITVMDGYEKTVYKFKKYHMLKYAVIGIKGDKVTVDLP